MIEAEVRKRLRSGGSLEEKPITPEFLGRGSAEYLTWKEGECREHPSTADRCRVSFASIGQFFGDDRLVHTIQTGDVERFKTWRRSAEGGGLLHAVAAASRAAELPPADSRVPAMPRLVVEPERAGASRPFCTSRFARPADPLGRDIPHKS